MTWITTHAADPTQRRHLLFEVDTYVVQRWTDCPIPIGYDGHVWIPRPTSVAGITTRQLDGAAATLTVANAGNFLSALFFSGGINDKAVKVWVACFDIGDNSQVPQQAILVFEGKVDSCVITNSGSSVEATITLGPPADQSTKLLPTRKLTDLLRHDP
jgi:hypothetical protein